MPANVFISIDMMATLLKKTQRTELDSCSLRSKNRCVLVNNCKYIDASSYTKKKMGVSAG